MPVERIAGPQGNAHHLLQADDFAFRLPAALRDERRDVGHGPGLRATDIVVPPDVQGPLFSWQEQKRRRHIPDIPGIDHSRRRRVRGMGKTAGVPELRQVGASAEVLLKPARPQRGEGQSRGNQSPLDLAMPLRVPDLEALIYVAAPRADLHHVGHRGSHTSLDEGLLRFELPLEVRAEEQGPVDRAPRKSSRDRGQLGHVRHDDLNAGQALQVDICASSRLCPDTARASGHRNN
mmetsp:Transcript_137112/g.273480  ORF Transcript_137112/g.273480 Transcript_137112/m.273480 type:complete len:235 (-) Transcript_137112:141-845(-)